jgi:hypothetical protein
MGQPHAGAVVVFELGDIVYVTNYCYAAQAPAIVVDIEESDGYKWYRVVFFDNDALYWYDEREVSKNGNT